MPRKNEVSVTLPKALADRIKAALPAGSNLTDFIKRWSEFGIRADSTPDLSGLLRALVLSDGTRKPDDDLKA